MCLAEALVMVTSFLVNPYSSIYLKNNITFDINFNYKLGYFIIFLICLSMAETSINLFKVVQLHFGIASY